MTARSNSLAVRNPLTKLAAAQKVAALPVEMRAAWYTLLMELRTDARALAQKSWAQRKAPMAAYWYAVSVYAGHAARLAR